MANLRRIFFNQVNRHYRTKVLYSPSRNGGTLKILVNYPNGDQKVLLDDNRIIILSTPYSDGRRKISSESGSEIGWLSREYSYNYQTAKFKDGTEYNIAQKSIIPSVNEICWEKTKSPQTEESSSTKQTDSSSPSQSNSPQEIVVNSSSRRDDTDNRSSELTEDDRMRLWNMEYRARSIAIESTDSKEVVALKNEINQITRYIMSNRRDYSDFCISSRKNKMSYNNAQYYLKEKEREKEALEKKLEEKLLDLKKLEDEQKSYVLRRDFLAINLIDTLSSYYGKSSNDEETCFLEVGLTPLKKANGEKSFADGKILIDTLKKYFSMSDGYPKGWKYAEYLLGKMGIKHQEIVDAREDAYIL